MITFLALAHMLDATQDAGLGWGGDNVPCTCTHVGCYARCWVGVGGVITFVALALAHKMWGHFDNLSPKEPE